LTGPETLSCHEIAKIFSKMTNQETLYMNISVPEARELMHQFRREKESNVTQSVFNLSDDLTNSEKAITSRRNRSFSG